MHLFKIDRSKIYIIKLRSMCTIFVFYPGHLRMPNHVFYRNGKQTQYKIHVQLLEKYITLRVLCVKSFRNHEHCAQIHNTMHNNMDGLRTSKIKKNIWPHRRL